MTIAISPLSVGEREFLRRAGNETLLYSYLAALAHLHGLAARYTGSMYFVMIPDEAEAVEMLNAAITPIEAVPPIAARMRRNVAAYRSLKDWAYREGDTGEVREAATRLMHECSDEREWLFAPYIDTVATPRAAVG